MKKKTCSLFVCRVLLVMFILGSQNLYASGKSDSKGITIGFSFGQNQHPFFVAMQKGAAAAAEKLGVNIVFQSADNSLERQVTQIENLIQRNVQAIIINPYDSEGVAAAINEALRSGIPVFAVDINVIGAEVTAFVASNNTKIGEMLADYVIRHIDNNSKIAIISNPQVTSTKQREDGFINKIRQTNIQIVANQGAGMERTKALEAAETILQSQSDIAAFIGINESSAMGILGACQAAGRTNILVTGVDATEDIMTAIKNKTQLSIGVSQDPYQMGYLSVENAVKGIKGEPIQKFIEVPIEYMTVDNIDKFIQREAQYTSN
jgi:ribose transport system substrate-binding protein